MPSAVTNASFNNDISNILATTPLSYRMDMHENDIHPNEMFVSLPGVITHENTWLNHEMIEMDKLSARNSIKSGLSNRPKSNNSMKLEEKKLISTNKKIDEKAETLSVSSSKFYEVRIAPSNKTNDPAPPINKPSNTKSKLGSNEKLKELDSNNH